MKSKILFPVVITLLVLLACQFSGQTPSDENEIPTQTQEVLSQSIITLTQEIPLQPTLTEIPAEIPPVPSLDSSSAEIYNSDMVLVPDGEFAMGSNDGSPDQQPVHNVYLNAYYIDKYEVSNKLYANCVNAGACLLPSNDKRFLDPNYAEHPVVYVNWSMANAYCEWRGTRLPTEAEWEKAARGTDERTYPWGKDISCKEANYFNGLDYCSPATDTSPIGSYEKGKSPYGVYDMAGNVAEWVADWYSETYYQNSLSSNPLGPDNGQGRVLRGGGWDSNQTFLTTSYRDWLDPSYSEDAGIGFRCARTP